MTAIDLLALLPFIAVALTAVLAMLSVAVRRCHAATFVITVLGLAVSALSLLVPARLGSRSVTGLLTLDPFTLFYSGLVLSAALAVAVFSYGYLKKCNGQREELYILLAVAVFGSMVLIASKSMVSLFLGLEILSISLYSLISYNRGSPQSAEAGVKYLILGSASSAFLVLGMALIYFESGTLQFARVATAASGGHVSGLVVAGGLALIIVAIGFKLSLVPFHMWVADVFEGSPAPITGFIATVSKGSVFALALRFFSVQGLHASPFLLAVFSLIAIVSMFAGNILALTQYNIKRMLAYSSVAHMGYLLIAFLATGEMAPVAVTLYLVAYFITSLGAFGTVSILSDGTKESATLDHVRGLAWRRPWLAAAFTAMLLSLAGIPLTAGFVGKFYVITAGLASGLSGLVAVLVINSAIGLCYYLRVIIAVYSPVAPEAQPNQSCLSCGAENAVMVLLTTFLVWVGVYPSALLRVIQSAVGSFL